jgi:pimeloyl-ACP methyl ester carboxylesterase
VKLFPVFIPYGEERLATVLATPDGDAAGLVVLLQGTGAPRSHRFQLWTRAARVLAECGLASVRLDYRGIGDSTGRALQPQLGDQRIEQALEVTGFALRTLGVDRVGVVGNCSGGIVGLGLAGGVPECRGAVLILPRLVELGGLTRVHMGARKMKMASLVRSHPLMRRVVQRTARGQKDLPSAPVRLHFLPAVDRSPLLFIYSEKDREPYVAKSIRLLRRMVDELPPGRRERVELRISAEGPLAGFESLSAQDWIIEESVTWLADRLGVALPERFLKVASSPER